MTQTTREGNPIYPSGAYRQPNAAIKTYYQSKELCRDCKHLGDLCEKQKKTVERRVKQKVKDDDLLVDKNDGIARSWVIACDGFEEYVE